MALSNLQRVKIILDLLGDGDVVDEDAYDNVDKVSNGKARYWSSMFYNSEGPLYDGGGAPRRFGVVNLEEGATFYIKCMAEAHRQAGYKATMKKAAERSASRAKDRIDRNIDGDFPSP